MMTIDKFTICVNKLAVLQGLTINTTWLVGMFEELSPYFDDVSFSNACREILHHNADGLFGKMPTLSMFMKYSLSKPKSILQLGNEAKQSFLNKVGEYLSDNFHSDSERNKFYSSLTYTEERALQSLGGMPSIWESCHREDFSRSISSIQKDLGEFFENNYSIENNAKKLIESRISEVTSIGNIAKRFLSNSTNINNNDIFDLEA